MQLPLMADDHIAEPSLNEGQQQAFDEIIPYLTGADKSHTMRVLKGYAGTGKTFLLTRIVKELVQRKNAGMGDARIAMSAPTHKAVRVMTKFSTFPHGSVHFCTVHSLLGLKAEVDEHGKEKFVESKDPSEVRIEQFNTLFLDETSMLPDELFVLLLKHVRRGLKILFVGDPVQIPPINHMDSIPFKPESVAKYGMGVSELTQIMRQAGENPILRLATTIRMGYKTVPHFLIETDTRVSPEGVMSGVQKVEANDDEYLDKVIEQYFVSPEFKADPDYMKIIAYTNKTVDYFNRVVRRRIYRAEPNKELPFIKEGEKLIMDKPLVLENNRILLTTNEEIEVLNFDVRDTTIDYEDAVREQGQWSMGTKSATMTYYNTFVSYFDKFGKKVQANIRILHEDSRKEMTSLVEGLKKTAQAIPYGSPYKRLVWRSFYAVQRLFAQVKYNYAITAHKSQGSTYDNCLVLDWDIAINRKIEERNRIRYVSITRARHLLLIQK